VTSLNGSPSRYSADNPSSLQNFYVDYRTRVAYAFSRHYPKFTSMEEWKSAEGTKLALLVRLLQHTLSHDTRAPVSFDAEGLGSYPPMPAMTDGEIQPQTSKVIVFQEFPMMADMIVSVSLTWFSHHGPHQPLQILELQGIECLTMNGSTKEEHREEVLSKFKTESRFRVLLMSMVGGIGLNLTVASTIIVFVRHIHVALACLHDCDRTWCGPRSVWTRSLDESTDSVKRRRSWSISWWP
jgi:SNF2 family DNA or RNA helicase